MRLIDADALKRKAQKCATEAWKMNLTAKIGTIINQFIDWIDEVPTVERWVPCSEKLPSDGDNVFVTVVDDHGDTPWRYTDVAWLCNGTWIANNEILFGDVIAWMPRPKPYRGGEESEVE